MRRTELLLTALRPIPFSVEFQQADTHKIPRESALLAAFKS